jgi:hypothetical protein
MRKFTLLLVVLGLAGSLWAANPDVGTWKLNVAQSKYPPSASAPKEETLVVMVVGDQIEATFTGTAADGKPISQKTIFPHGGGAVKPVPASYDAEIMIVVCPYEFYGVALKDGKQQGFEHVVISKDGKTKHDTLKGRDSQGKPVQELRVWDKQ